MPLFVAVLSPITIREPITRSVVMGLALALAGGIAIALGVASEVPLYVEEHVLRQVCP